MRSKLPLFVTVCMVSGIAMAGNAQASWFKNATRSASKTVSHAATSTAHAVNSTAHAVAATPAAKAVSNAATSTAHAVNSTAHAVAATPAAKAVSNAATSTAHSVSSGFDNFMKGLDGVKKKELCIAAFKKAMHGTKPPKAVTDIVSGLAKVASAPVAGASMLASAAHIDKIAKTFGKDSPYQKAAIESAKKFNAAKSSLFKVFTPENICGGHIKAPAALAELRKHHVIPDLSFMKKAEIAPVSTPSFALHDMLFSTANAAKIENPEKLVSWHLAVDGNLFVGLTFTWDIVWPEGKDNEAQSFLTIGRGIGFEVGGGLEVGMTWYPGKAGSGGWFTDSSMADFPGSGYSLDFGPDYWVSAHAIFTKSEKANGWQGIGFGVGAGPGIGLMGWSNDSTWKP